MKTQTIIFALLVATIAGGGCQKVKETGGKVATSFRQSGKQFAQQKIDEWVALAGVQVNWDTVPPDFRRHGWTRFVFGKNRTGSLSYSYCEPSPSMDYARRRESITSRSELLRFVIDLGWAVANCDGGVGRERYLIAYEAVQWALARTQESGLRLTDQQRADSFCGIDSEVRKYQREKPGRPIDTDVLDWIKDNPLPSKWTCGRG